MSNYACFNGVGVLNNASTDTDADSLLMVSVIISFANTDKLWTWSHQVHAMKIQQRPHWKLEDKLSNALIEKWPMSCSTEPNQKSEMISRPLKEQHKY